MKKNQHGCCGINSVEVGRIHRDGNKCLNQGHNGRDEVSWALSPKHCESRLINDHEQNTRKESRK